MAADAFTCQQAGVLPLVLLKHGKTGCTKKSRRDSISVVIKSSFVLRQSAKGTAYLQVDNCQLLIVTYRSYEVADI
ncbi:MAG: hypothetical protein AAF573_01090 [Bacteroidota bacterium]